jgi:hypothetical protein
VRYQDATELAADLHTCLAELRSREDASVPGEGSKTVKLEAGAESTVAAPLASAIVSDTSLPVSRHFDSAAALRRVSKSRSGRAPRRVGLVRRILFDAPPRRLFVATVLAALAGSFIALA